MGLFGGKENRKAQERELFRLTGAIRCITCQQMASPIWLAASWQGAAHTQARARWRRPTSKSAAD